MDSLFSNKSNFSVLCSETHTSLAFQPCFFTALDRRKPLYSSLRIKPWLQIWMRIYHRKWHVLFKRYSNQIAFITISLSFSSLIRRDKCSTLPFITGLNKNLSGDVFAIWATNGRRLTWRLDILNFDVHRVKLLNFPFRFVQSAVMPMLTVSTDLFQFMHQLKKSRSSVIGCKLFHR